MKYLRDNGKIFVEYVFDNYYMCRGFAVTVARSYGRNQLYSRSAWDDFWWFPPAILVSETLQENI